MLVAAGQFAVTPDWRANAQTCVALMAQAAEQGASLLVLPEALLARDDSDPDLSVKSAQEIDGGFLCLLREESRSNGLTTVLTIHVPSGEDARLIRWWRYAAARLSHNTRSYTYTMRLIYRSRGALMPACRSRR